MRRTPSNTHLAAGFIPYARKIWNHPYVDEPLAWPRLQALMWLISFTRYAPQQQFVKGAIVEIPRAHFLASLRFLATRFRWAPAKVRRFIAELERDGTLRTVRETPGGTLYHLVNYELYQLGRVGVETLDGSPTDTHVSQRQNRDETKRIKGTTASKKDSTMPWVSSPGSSTSAAGGLPKAAMDAIYETWVARIGTVNYGRLRKALQPIYESVATGPTGEAVIRALEAFSEGRDADRPQYRGSWTPEKFGADIHSWIRIGAMELIDEYGSPTERGIASGIFDS